MAPTDTLATNDEERHPWLTAKAPLRRQRLLVAVAAAAAIGACAYFALRPQRVAVLEVTRGVAIEAVYASGSIEAKNRVDVRARVAGPLKSLLVREGDAVQKDQLIANIDAPSLGYDVQRGQADLGSAFDRANRAPLLQALEAQRRGLQAQLVEAQDEVRRQEQLSLSGAITPQQLQRAQTAARSIEAEIAANRAQEADAKIGLHGDAERQRAILASLQDRAKDTEVHSPMSGTVLVRRAEEGEIVAVNQTLLRVGDLRHLWLESRVDEADVGRLRIGMPASIELYAFSNRPIVGRVANILPDGDRDRKSFEVDIDFDEPIEGLRCGMSAEINIIVQKHDRSLLIPSDSVRKNIVWVLDKNNRAERRDVKLGIRDLVNVEVTDGIAEGERVVLNGDALALKPGRRLAPSDPPPSTAKQNP